MHRDTKCLRRTKIIEPISKCLHRTKIIKPREIPRRLQKSTYHAHLPAPLWQMFITEETLSCSKAGQVSHLPCYVCSRAVNPRVQSSGVHVAERGRKLFPCRVEVGEACCVNDWRGVKMTRAIGECPHGISCRAHSSQASCTQWPAAGPSLRAPGGSGKSLRSCVSWLPLPACHSYSCTAAQLYLLSC
jgi:hypothetical protein